MLFFHIQSRKKRIALQMLFVFSWMSTLCRTERFPAGYLLWGIAGTFFLWGNSRTPVPLQTRSPLPVYPAACLVGAASILCNLSLFSPLSAATNWVNLLFCLAGGFFLAYHILVSVLRFSWKPWMRKAGLQSVLIFFWLISLRETDAIFSAYVFCALAGILCLCSNCSSTLSAGTRLPLYLFAGLFSLATLLANYPLFSLSASVWTASACILSFLGGACVGFHVLLAMLNRLPWTCARTTRSHAGPVFLLSFCSIAAIDLAYLLFSLYPGVLSRDSFSTLAQIMGDQAYNNTMPFWHTVTVEPFLRLGLALWGDMNKAVALFHGVQSLFMAACFSFALVTLYQVGVPAILLAVVYGVYAFSPYNISYAVTLLKDVPFSGAALLFVTALYRILKHVGKSQLLNYLLLLMGILGFSLWRTNGWYAFLATWVVMLPLVRRKHPRLLGLMALMLVLCWVLINPVLDFIGVSKTDLVETTAIPMQQISRVVAKNRPLTQEDTELLSQIFDLEKVAQLYTPEIADPVKFQAFRRDQTSFFMENFRDYLGLYLRLGLRYPADYLHAWVEQTKGYWNGGYHMTTYTFSLSQDSYGLTRGEPLPLVRQLFTSLFWFWDGMCALNLFSFTGLSVWGTFGCCIVSILKKREEFLLTIPLLVLAVGLWLGSPLCYGFRYAYPILLTLPLIACVTAYQPEEDA